MRSPLLLRRSIATTAPRLNSSTESTEVIEHRVRSWITRITAKTHVQEDRIDPYQLQLLDLTLPPFNADPQDVPARLEPGTPIIPGTELMLFPPLVRTAVLLPDGTDSTFSSPAPFSRRMWAGGEFAFDLKNPLCVGQTLRCETIIEDVELQRWEKSRESGVLESEPMVYVKQRRDVFNENGVAVVEKRTHVYRPENSALKSSEVTEKKRVAMHTGEYQDLFIGT
jgi:hydroxyacyl-ACP dehydratase HTD2-like protein with hotdog domain